MSDTLILSNSTIEATSITIIIPIEIILETQLFPFEYQTQNPISEESNKIIEAHLSECSSCKDYYNSLCEADEIFAAPQNAELEMKKSASFR